MGLMARCNTTELLEQTFKLLQDKLYIKKLYPTPITPSKKRPLTQTWYGFNTRVEPTRSPDYWEDCVQECAQLLEKNGAVVVEFWSPDHPDDYTEFLYTTPDGDFGNDETLTEISSYTRSMGNKDIDLALEKMYDDLEKIWI